MNRIFVISDTHFGHKNIIGFEGALRPFKTIEEHDEELVRRWNETVNKRDTVLHLGDVLFGRESFSILKRLNGVKKLVMGNHDRYSATLYLEHFNSVHGSLKYKDYLLTHVPIHPYQFYRFKGNIHGHMHSKKMDDLRYICVSAEQTGLRPVLINDLIKESEMYETGGLFF